MYDYISVCMHICLLVSFMCVFSLVNACVIFASVYVDISLYVFMDVCIWACNSSCVKFNAFVCAYFTFGCVCVLHKSL